MLRFVLVYQRLLLQRSESQLTTPKIAQSSSKQRVRVNGHTLNCNSLRCINLTIGAHDSFDAHYSCVDDGIVKIRIMGSRCCSTRI